MVNSSSADAEIQAEQSSASIPVPRITTDDEVQRQLQSVGVVEFLEIDDRPAFILDLDSPSRPVPIYCNPSLREIPLLESRIVKSAVGSGAARDGKYASFVDWATSLQRNNSIVPYMTYSGVKWTTKTIRKRWRIITGEVGMQPVDFQQRRQTDILRGARASPSLEEKPRAQSRAAIPPSEPIDEQLAAFNLRRETRVLTFPSNNPSSKDFGRDSPAETDCGIMDWTDPSPGMELSSHLQFVSSYDWGSTELGPMSSWSNDLRRMANVLMADPRPASLYWGRSRTLLYNEAYIPVLGQKHPRMLGKTFSEAWAEVQDDFNPAFESVYETGKAYVIDDARFYIERERHGILEETYFSIAIVPIYTDSGEAAFYNPVSETTKQVIADRRMACMLRVGQYISSSREPKDFWQQLLLGLDTNHFDLPFVVLYSAGSDVNETLSESSEMSQNLRNWVLEGGVRIPDLSRMPVRITNERSMEEFLPNFLDLIKKESPTLLLAENGTLPEVLKSLSINMDGEILCEAAVFLPIRSTGENILGFLVAGVNPRRAFDDDYRVFVELLNRQLANAMASAVLFEEEIRRGIMAAEQASHDNKLLSKKLAITTHEALETETRFRQMADLAPVGMFHIDSEGVIIYANEDYYTMTEHPRDVRTPMSWYNALVDEDHPAMDAQWAKLMSGEAVNFEIRLKREFVAEDVIGGEKVGGYSWILAAAYPEKREDGTVTSVLGCITDISRQKWMEGFQTRKMLEAVELKRQQENFIDMTSHEMRNPLSAIIQCADWICTSLNEFGGETKNVTIPREMVDGYEDAAQTIVLCAQHQKRIIDDILMLSKLDSDLLLITPVEVRPITVVENALKMFDNELQKTDVNLRFILDPSYSTHSVDWVKLDPSRLLQVLINLTTNAIKFTQSEPQRKITITLAASTSPPVSINGIEFLARSSSRKDLSLGPDWGDGETLFLRIEVNDTGRGLDEHERNLLFKRFSQTSPRTHVQYGGSGLGLFISRELTELQGGQIGVSSKAGVGSTFAFYIRARRCEAPTNQADSSTSHAIDMRAQTKIIPPRTLTRLQNGALSSKKNEAKLVKPKNVLIVEDNIVNQKVLSKQLRSAGCIVHVANHGVEALSFLSTTSFSSTADSPVQLDVILMDLEMPIMDGLTCVRKIRQMEEYGEVKGHVPVIAVTANARSAQISEAKEAGMDSVVTKPFRIPELLPEIERQIESAAAVGLTPVRPTEVERSWSAPTVLEGEI